MKNIFSILMVIYIIFLSGCGSSTTTEDNSTIGTEIDIKSDEDSQAPLFLTSSTVDIFENEQEIVTIVTDEEATYLLGGVDKDFFELMGSTLVFKKIPDFELDKHIYMVTVEAIDHAGNKSEQNLEITLQNVAELRPELADTTLTVAENVVAGVEIGTIDIVSQGDSNITTIELVGDGSENFDVDIDGRVTLSLTAMLDYETTRSYELYALAMNEAGESDSVNLLVNIENIADIKAELDSASFTIDENVTVGTEVGVVNIRSYGDSNITEMHLFGDGSEKFEISSSGVVKVANNAELDYETQNSFDLSVTALNGAGESESVSVVITLNDIADVKPELAEKTMSVAENADAGVEVGTIEIVSQGDSNITEILLSGDGNENFDVDIDGKVRVSQSAELDYDSVSSYDLNATAVNDAGESESVQVVINVLEVNAKDIPTLVIVMNWNDYAESDASLWYDKIFNSSENSVTHWYSSMTYGEINIYPIEESSGTNDDGIIMVDMGKDHPGGGDDTAFRDTEITNAITSSEVVDNVDFTLYDTDGDGALSLTELQIIFIVAGGERSYGDAIDHSIWAHSWSYDSDSDVKVDGIYVMRYTGDEDSGSYSRFGANHDDHKATIGIIAHEMGHSLLNLEDYYDNGGGSGLGYYDIMSGGSWAQKDSSVEAGENPTQLSVYNKIDAALDVNLTELDSSADVTIKCSSNDLIKLNTSKDNEYFLVECRDTANSYSDISFNYADEDFTEDRLFMMAYHVDTEKSGNTEDGEQTEDNHYKVALVEKDSSELMTSTEYIRAEYDDVYIDGDSITTSQTKLYDATQTDYAIEVIAEDSDNRTMTLRITK